MLLVFIVRCLYLFILYCLSEGILFLFCNYIKLNFKKKKSKIKIESVLIKYKRYM